MLYDNDNNGNELREKISYIVPFDRSMRQQTAADPYGNTTIDAISSLIEKVTNTFDGFNRLKTETKVKSGVRVVVKYTYNGDGLRTQKTVTSSKDNNTTKVTNYLYDRQHVILETDQNGQLLTRYIRGVNYLARMDSSNQLYNYLYNGHGDVVQTVTEAGVVENQYDYDIFGNPILTEEQHSNAIRYAGEFYDVETGFYYLRARYYNPYIGRFISEDSVWGEDTNPLSLNLYTYVHNDPINFIDPTGHLEQGDNQLSQANQNKIKDLTDAYFSADTQKEKDKIHAEAQSIRDNAKKDTSKSGDSFAQDANSAIKNSKHVDSNGKSYITGSEWRSLSKKHHRRSGGVSQQMEQRHEEQSLNSHHIAKHTLTQTINAIESQAANNMDYTIGSADYAQSVSLMAKEMGVKPTQEFVFNDFMNHTSEFMTGGGNDQSSKDVHVLSVTASAGFGASSNPQADLLNEMNKLSPDDKINFVKNFFKKFSGLPSFLSSPDLLDRMMTNGMGYGKGIVDFMNWEKKSGRLDQSKWWQNVNAQMLADMKSALTIWNASKNKNNLKSDISSVQVWLNYMSDPNQKNLWSAHNTSIIKGYKNDIDLLHKETKAEQTFAKHVVFRVVSIAPKLAPFVTTMDPSLKLLVSNKHWPFKYFNYPNYYPATFKDGSSVTDPYWGEKKWFEKAGINESEKQFYKQIWDDQK